ncbi:MAG: SCP-like domain protein [Deltaproteobacteria bacterium]|nr:SCP-like domain protein [Deltaproteobacteria bacterium]
MNRLAGEKRERPPYRRHLAAMAILSLLVLPACLGGGGGEESVTAADNIVTPPPAGGAPDPGVADIQDEFLDAVNQARSASRMCGSVSFGPSPPVSWSSNIAMAAWLHSSDMALNGFFSHTGSDGSSAGQRITRQGYAWHTYGENIAVGYPTVASVMAGWLGSEGHCRNLMDPDFTEIGAGYAVGAFGGNPAARYWTFDLAD